MERTGQVDGAEEDGLEKALLVKGTYIATPAVPERAFLRVSPFWKEERSRWGRGMVRRGWKSWGWMKQGSIWGRRERRFKALVGPVGKYQRAMFKRLVCSR